jgi:hypothetical protein
MKPSIWIIAASLLVAGGTVTSANAVEFDVGPGGVYVGHGHRHHFRDYRDDCRIVIRHRTNRFGEDVTVRKRICD